jgi:hypothetical protein
LHKIVAVITSVLVIVVFWRSLSYASLQRKAAFLLVIVLALMAAGCFPRSLKHAGCHSTDPLIARKHFVRESVCFPNECKELAREESGPPSTRRARREIACF